MKKSNFKSQIPNLAQNLNSDRKYDLEERTTKFGENIITFVKTLKNDEINRPLIGQLIHSGTSFGAHYMEADAAQSKKDFQHKICFVKKEAKQTKHWLRMVAKANPHKKIFCNQLWK